MHDCELDHMHNFHHDGNIGNFLSPKAVGYCDDSEKFLYGAFEFQKIESNEDIEAFANGIPTVEIKKCLTLNYNYNYLYSNNMKKINSLNPTDIGFDERSKEEIKNLYRIKSRTT